VLLRVEVTTYVPLARYSLLASHHSALNLHPPASLCIATCQLLEFELSQVNSCASPPSIMGVAKLNVGFAKTYANEINEYAKAKSPVPIL
jgi:hypothetical protein